MTRVALTDNSGRWFNSDSSIVIQEGTRWDGNNHISLSTGSQWNHETLYYTASGRWVLNRWSQWQGSTESYELVTDQDAAEWLVRNERSPLTELPDAVRSNLDSLIAAMHL